MSAIIAWIAGREALDARPRAKPVTAIHAGSRTKASAATVAEVASCAPSRVGRRPSRSASTPPSTDAMTPPSPIREATRPAYAAENPREAVRYSARNVRTKLPSRLTRVLVHSHQNSRGSPETDSVAARLSEATDMGASPGADVSSA